MPRRYPDWAGFPHAVPRPPLAPVKVVVAHTLPAAGLDKLEARFDVEIGGVPFDRDWLRKHAPGASAIVADPTVPVDGELLDLAGDTLRVVSNFAVGFDNIDTDAVRERGLRATNTPDVLTNATAELAVALMLAAAPAAGGDRRAGSSWRLGRLGARAVPRPGVVGGDGRARRLRAHRLARSRSSCAASTRGSVFERARSRMDEVAPSTAPSSSSSASCWRCRTTSACTSTSRPETRHLIGARGAGGDEARRDAGQHLPRRGSSIARRCRGRSREGGCWRPGSMSTSTSRTCPAELAGLANAVLAAARRLGDAQDARRDGRAVRRERHRGARCGAATPYV